MAIRISAFNLTLVILAIAGLQTASASDDAFRNELQRARNEFSPKPKASGVSTRDGVFAASVSVWGSEAILLAKKLQYSGVESLSNPSFTVNIVGDLKSGNLFEVISGGLATRSAPDGAEMVERFNVYLPDPQAEFGKGIPVGWSAKIDPHLSISAQAQDPISLISGGEALGDLLGSLGKFRTIQPTNEAKAILDLILSPDTPIFNLHNRHRVRGLYWQPETKRLVRVDEPPSRTFWDYESIEEWASRLAIQVWKVGSKPAEFKGVKSLVAKKLTAKDIGLPQDNSIYPEPAVVTIRISDDEIVQLPWVMMSNDDPDAKGAKPAIIQQEKSGYKVLNLVQLSKQAVHANFWKSRIDVAGTKVKESRKSSPSNYQDAKSDKAFCEFMLKIVPPNDSKK